MTTTPCESIVHHGNGVRVVRFGDLQITAVWTGAPFARIAYLVRVERRVAGSTQPRAFRSIAEEDDDEAVGMAAAFIDGMPAEVLLDWLRDARDPDGELDRLLSAPAGVPRTAVPTVRWMIRRDLGACLATEADSFGLAWDEDDFLARCRQRHVIGLVAEMGDQVVGYVVYELYADNVRVVNFAVAPPWRRHGVGAAMVGRVKRKVTETSRRRHLVVELRAAMPEDALDARLFWTSQGFREGRPGLMEWQPAEDTAA